MTLPPDLPGQPSQTGAGEQPPQPSQDPASWQDVADVTASGAVPPDAPATPARRSRKGLLVGSVAALVVLGGAGAWAYGALSGGGAQPEAALPASTLLFVDVDLDPSAGQKINLLRLANRIPDLGESLGVDIDDHTDLRQVITEAIARDGECDIDFAADVEPWVGSRAAFAAVPGEDEPAFALVLAVTDEKAARAAIESGLGCGEGVAPEQVAFAEGFAVVTEEGVAAADVVADAAKASLADHEPFSADMKAIGDTGLVSIWMDMQAAQELADSAAAVSGVTPDMGMLTNVAEYGTVAGAVRANADSIEFASVLTGDEELLAQLRDTRGVSVTDLPASTLVAAGSAVDPAAVDKFWEQIPEALGTMGGDQAMVDDAVALLADQYDIHLPEDLATLLGEQVVLAVDSEGLDDVAGMSSLTDVNVGLRTVGDTAALQDLADRVNALVTMTGVEPLATAETEDGRALATNDGYAEALTGGGDLGSSEAFTSVIEDEDATSVLFLNFDELATVLADPLADEDALTYLEPLRALGMTGGVEGDHATATFRLSFD